MGKLQDIVEETQCDFDIPPTKKQRRKYFGRSLIKSWVREFKERVWFIPHYPVMSFHVLFGQLPNIKNIKINVGSSSEDCRIHLLLLQESGSGKGGGFTFLNKLSEKTGTIFHNIGDVTNAALIGTLKPQSGGKTKVNPGVLDPRYNNGEGVDIVACNEASGLIDTRTEHFDKNALLNLQRAMNRIGTADNVITKETGIGQKVVKFNTDVSFFLTTFEPRRMFQTMTETGLLQRLVVIYNPISLKDKWKVAKRHANMLENGDKENRKSNISNIVGALRWINSCYDGVPALKLTDEAKEALRDKILPLIYKPLLEMDSHTMNEAKKFSTRYQVILYRLAWHHAMARLSNTVEIKDMLYARKIFIPIYRELLAYMENKYTVSSEQKLETASERGIIKEVYNELAEGADAGKKPWVRKPYLIGELSKRWGVSKEGARQKLEKHISLFKTDISRSNSVIMKLR